MEGTKGIFSQAGDILKEFAQKALEPYPSGPTEVESSPLGHGVTVEAKPQAEITEITEKHMAFKATSNKRLDGIVSLLRMGTVGLMNLIAAKVKAIASRAFGFAITSNAAEPTEKFKTKQDQDREQLKSLVGQLRTPQQLDSQKVTDIIEKKQLNIIQGGQQTPEATSLFMLNNCMKAMIKLTSEDVILGQNSGGNFDKIRNDQNFRLKLADILEHPTTETPAKIQEHFAKAYAAISENSKQAKKEFMSEATLERGRNVPREITHEFTTDLAPGMPADYTEKAKTLDLKTGALYLQAKGGYIKQSIYINGLDGGIRPSAARNEAEVQGATINGFAQTLYTGHGDDAEPLETIYRSGAFAVHDGKKPGVAKLVEIKKRIDDLNEQLSKLPLPEQKELYQKIKNEQAELFELCQFSDEELKQTNGNGTLALNARLENRRDLAIAHALPKLTASVKDAVQGPEALKNAIAAGSFLHVEVSALSDLNGSDLNMAQDMKGAMDHLRENLTVKFTLDPDGEKIEIGEDGQIIMTLHATIDLKVDFPAEGLGVTTLFFTQGYNEQQSIGHALGKEGVQDQYNEEAYGHLETWLISAVKGDMPELEVLAKHYSLDAEREVKDVEGMRLLHAVVREAKGGFGVVCKSGKDRTSGITAALLADTAAEGVNKDEDLYSDNFDKDHAQREVRDALLGGISYEITELNVGTGGKGFAFNPMQQETIPPEIRPPAHLCRGGPS